MFVCVSCLRGTWDSMRVSSSKAAHVQGLQVHQMHLVPLSCRFHLVVVQAPLQCRRH